MPRKLLTFLLPIMLTGCMHTVGYKLTESDRWTGPKIQGVLCVQPITDSTVYGIADWKPQHTTNGVWTVNSRGGYNHPNLTGEVTAMVSKHLAYSGLFTKVQSSDTNADYILSGTLAEFRVNGRVNRKAEVIMEASAGFGAIGALIGAGATSDMKSEVKTSVKLDKLQIAGKAGQVLWQDSIGVDHDDNVSFAYAEGPAMYEFPDKALKEAVGLLIQRLGNSSLTNHAAEAARQADATRISSSKSQ
jgi:hypothetical protein